MPTKLLEIEGIFEWAKVFEQNRDYRYSEETDGEYQLSIIMDDDNAKKLKATGCQKKMTPDPEGRGTVVRLTRPHTAPNKWGGGPPAVGRPDGTKWDLEEDGLIGNGSTGRVRVAVYDTNTGRKGTRLEAIQVVNHIRHVGEGDSVGSSLNSFFKDMTSVTAPATNSPSPATKSKKVAEALADDDIPF